jgi:hypothetical protein
MHILQIIKEKCAIFLWINPSPTVKINVFWQNKNPRPVRVGD